MICRTGFAGQAPTEDYPLSNRFDEVDALVIFDDVLIPWENVLFHRHTKAATFIRATLHRYSAFAFIQRNLKAVDMMIGAALWNVKQTGLEKQQAVQEKLSTLACYREGINAHMTAAIATAEPSPAGLLMPNQSLLYTGRVLACSQFPEMMHIARELCGGQICITPDAAAFEHPESGKWLKKYYSINENWVAEDRRKLLAFARDLLNSDYGGHRLTFQLFAQSPPFAHLAAVHRNFDWNGPLRFVQKSANLSDKIWGEKKTEMAHQRIRKFNTNRAVVGVSHQPDQGAGVTGVFVAGAIGRHQRDCSDVDHHHLHDGRLYGGHCVDRRRHGDRYDDWRRIDRDGDLWSDYSVGAHRHSSRDR